MNLLYWNVRVQGYVWLDALPVELHTDFYRYLAFPTMDLRSRLISFLLLFFL